MARVVCNNHGNLLYEYATNPVIESIATVMEISTSLRDT